MHWVRFVLRGPPLEAAASLARLLLSTLAVCGRRVVFGPRLPAWTFNFEIATDFFRAQGKRAFRIAGDGSGIPAARRMIDTLVFRLPHLDRMSIIPDTTAPVGGRWFVQDINGPIGLHFHGGGYVFSPAMTDNLIAAVARAVGGRTFVPDYRLGPEHPFPCQLEDALRSYEWLLAQAGPQPRVVLSGDSSGGHLVFALLSTLAVRNLPLPRASITISPWTDPGGDSASLHTNAPTDWMTAEMLERMASWAGGVGRPMFRLIEVDLSSLRDVLVHAGEAEICHDMVQDFCARARAAGADVACESFPGMNHNFHGFGDMLPQSREALERIGSFVAERTRAA
ncbi:MAG: alpha/beta hydrolase fold domain-containing protein [Xanthobacteraceae bacterium]